MLRNANAHGDCPNCGGCCTTPCGEEMKCTYSDSCIPCCHIVIVPGANLEIKAGDILAQSSVDGLFYPYDPAGTDGLNMPRGIAQHSATTDDDGGYVRYTNQFNPDCPKLYYMNMFIKGSFRVEETNGDLASALAANSFGRLLTGFTHSSGTWTLL